MGFFGWVRHYFGWVGVSGGVWGILFWVGRGEQRWVGWALFWVSGGGGHYFEWVGRVEVVALFDNAL